MYSSFRFFVVAFDRNQPDSERMTPFGRLLRSASLDELPELWNVLKGDMSLVGPRAIAPSCHNPKQLSAKFVDRRSQHALGLDACLAGRVEPQQVHHDVANDGQVVGGIAAAHP